MIGTAQVAGRAGASPKGAPKRRPRKHADGEGLLRQRKDGLWEGRLMVGVKPDGKPDVRSVYGKTQEEALDRLADLRQRRRTNAVADPKAERQTVASYLEHWLAVTEGTVRASTWHRYGEHVHLHLIAITVVEELHGLFSPRELARDLADREVLQQRPDRGHRLGQAGWSGR